MDLHELKPKEGARRRRTRVGRGTGSGLGKTSGRGHKGQKSRSGYSKKGGFEGGQMMLHLRLPKRGFTNVFKTEYQVVNVGDLARCDGSEITRETIIAAGLAKASKGPIKVLANGEIDRACTVRAAAFSKSAIAKIEAAGGKAEVA
jgi:large subunit ribosomal protein L15